MSSANFYSGYNPEKPTSKVLAPPGGRSNNIFGTSEPVAVRGTNGFTAQEDAQNIANQKTFMENQFDNQQNKRLNHTSHILFGDDSTQVTQSHSNRYQPDRQKSTIFEDHSNCNKNKTNARVGGFNPITGQAYEEAPHKTVEPEPQVQVVQAPEPPKNGDQPTKAPPHTSSRVLQPPGGRSTALW